MDNDKKLMLVLINALEKHNYEVSIEEPNNVSIREKYDGSKYLYIRGDDAKFGVCFGCCTVQVQGHSFTCDLDYGEWSAENEKDSWLIDEDEFIEALENADGVISGIMGEPDEQAKVYFRANNIKEESLPVYWCEDDDIPKDIINLDLFDPAVVKVFVSMKDGSHRVVNCEIPCSSIYELYCSLKKKRKLYKDATVSSTFIKKELPILQQEIIDELLNHGVINENQDANYHLDNSEEFFESILG